jgi:hypothetical protein
MVGFTVGIVGRSMTAARPPRRIASLPSPGPAWRSRHRARSRSRFEIGARPPNICIPFAKEPIGKAKQIIYSVMAALW